VLISDGGSRGVESPDFEKNSRKVRKGVVVTRKEFCRRSRETPNTGVPSSRSPQCNALSAPRGHKKKWRVERNLTLVVMGGGGHSKKSTPKDLCSIHAADSSIGEVQKIIVEKGGSA